MGQQADGADIDAGVPDPADTVVHGGDLSAARRLFPHAPLPWIDLSTGINPLPYPFTSPTAEAWHRLPDRTALHGLEAAAARAYGASQPAQVVAAPGTQALIQVLPRLLPRARRVAVLGFGYQEHPAVWRATGATVTVAGSIGELDRADVAVVVNPNNPDGRLVERAALAALADRCARRGATLVVDEAFMDVMEPGWSLVPDLPAQGALVLRSFGKAYGLAGLRLGFAIAAPDLAARLRTALGAWPVSGPAIAIGSAALDDRAWMDTAVSRLRAAARRLDGVLVEAGFRLLGGTPLFRLVAHDDAAAWAVRLGEAGILVRVFPSRPGWLRFGLPGDPVAWARLGVALRDGRPLSRS